MQFLFSKCQPLISLCIFAFLYILPLASHHYPLSFLLHIYLALTSFATGMTHFIFLAPPSASLPATSCSRHATLSYFNPRPPWPSLFTARFANLISPTRHNKPRDFFPCHFPKQAIHTRLHSTSPSVFIQIARTFFQPQDPASPPPSLL